MKICQNCGHENTDSGKFCEECGTKLVEAPKFCPECGTKLEGMPKFCPECGFSLLSGENNDEDYLYLPDIYFVKEGKIIGHDNESAFVATSNEEYSIDEIKNKLFNKYVKLLNDYNREDTDE